jgi:urate oxidase
MAVLAENHYGKSRVRVMKVVRKDAEHHEVFEWTVGVYLTGDFDAVFCAGDNTGITATDTMKNSVYMVARTSTATTLEGFAVELAEFFLRRNPRLQSARVVVDEKMWVRIRAKGEPHGSAFLQRGPDVATAEAVAGPGQPTRVTAGVRGLVILKTAHSGFSGFDRDELTTLPYTEDRLLGTEATIQWPYATAPADYQEARKRIMDALLGTFATHESLSVQHTLFAMGEAALAAAPEIGEISLTMPNRHNLPVNLVGFGQDNPGMIFMPTDEPHGHIHARVVRG